jgi:hypothetical protein
MLLAAKASQPHANIRTAFVFIVFIFSFCERIANSSSTKTQSIFHPLAQRKRFPSPRCASTIQIVRPRESMAEIQPKLQPALLRLSAIISQYFTPADSASFVLSTPQ